jgi:hypothetical protein
MKNRRGQAWERTLFRPVRGSGSQPEFVRSLADQLAGLSPRRDPNGDVAILSGRIREVRLSRQARSAAILQRG